MGIKNKKETMIKKYGVDNIWKHRETIDEMHLKSSKTLRQNNDLKYNAAKNDILNSDIDFSKSGWVSKASKIIGITPQAVSKWMKRNMPDFYEEKCFKRKNTLSE